jgi:D-3-phosphoglycerate dehydrogenase
LLAQTAEVMGMKIIGYDPYISIDAAWRLPKDVEKADSLEYLLNNSDYISIHVPLVEETKNLISKESLKHFKKGSKLIKFIKRRHSK